MTSSLFRGSGACEACRKDAHHVCVFLTVPVEVWNEAANLACACYLDRREWHELLLQRSLLRVIAVNSAPPSPTVVPITGTSGGVTGVGHHPAADPPRPHDATDFSTPPSSSGLPRVRHRR